jgi:hypothetical protein
MLRVVGGSAAVGVETATHQTLFEHEGDEHGLGGLVVTLHGTGSFGNGRWFVSQEPRGSRSVPNTRSGQGCDTAARRKSVGRRHAPASQATEAGQGTASPKVIPSHLSARHLHHNPSVLDGASKCLWRIMGVGTQEEPVWDVGTPLGCPFLARSRVSTCLLSGTSQRRRSYVNSLCKARRACCSRSNSSSS